MSLADETLAEALRARDEYRARLRQIVHQRTDEELADLYAAFKASEMPRDQPVASADFLIRTDLRVAVKQEQNQRSAWAEIEQGVGS